MTGLRERKKQATRESILRAAFDLFAEQGYESTSVNRIAEAAMVAPATFFTYFPSKEDVVFADQADRVAAVSGVLRSRRPDEPVRDLVQRAFEQVAGVGPVAGSDGLLVGRGTIVARSPVLRSAAVSRLFDVQRHWGEELSRVAPELPARRARILVGAVTGAAVAAVTHEIETGGSNVIDAARDAVRTTLADGL